MLCEYQSCNLFDFSPKLVHLINLWKKLIKTFCIGKFIKLFPQNEFFIILSIILEEFCNLKLQIKAKTNHLTILHHHQNMNFFALQNFKKVNDR